MVCEGTGGNSGGEKEGYVPLKGATCFIFKPAHSRLSQSLVGEKKNSISA